MKKILVPVDFSDHTQISCIYALELARQTGGQIKLFHTYFDQVVVADTNFPETLELNNIYNEELVRDIRTNAEALMLELEETVREMIIKSGAHHVQLITMVSGGEVEHELREICHDFRPDLVVMGTTGRGNTLQVWGKVSSFIMDHAKVPVITIPALQDFRGFANIMFAADLTEGNDKILSTLLHQFAYYSCVVHVVHFIPKGKDSEAHVKMKTLRLKFQQEEKHHRVRFDVVLVEEDNQKAIEQFVDERHIDLIAFHPHKRSLLHMLFTRKITRKNLFEVNIPMIAMPS